MAAHKEAGNRCYGNGQWAEAIAEYEKAVAELTGGTAEEGTATERRALIAVCHNNAAQCYLKLKKYEQASRSAAACLEVEPGNVKALFRRATALEKMGEFKAALKDYEKVGSADRSKAKSVAKARARITRAMKQAFKGAVGGAAGSRAAGGAGGAGAGGAGAGALPQSRVRLDNLTYEEAMELKELDQRVKAAQAEVKKLELAGKRLKIEAKEMMTEDYSRLFAAVGKAYIFRTVEEAKSEVENKYVATEQKRQTSEAAANKLKGRLQQMLEELSRKQGVRATAVKSGSGSA